MLKQTLSEENYSFFLETNLDKYKGQWVTICDNKIINHGEELKKVIEKTKKECKNKKFLTVRVPSNETMIF